MLLCCFDAATIGLAIVSLAPKTPLQIEAIGKFGNDYQLFYTTAVSKLPDRGRCDDDFGTTAHCQTQQQQHQHLCHPHAAP